MPSGWPLTCGYGLPQVSQACGSTEQSQRLRVCLDDAVHGADETPSSAAMVRTDAPATRSVRMSRSRSARSWSSSARRGLRASRARLRWMVDGLTCSTSAARRTGRYASAPTAPARLRSTVRMRWSAAMTPSGSGMCSTVRIPPAYTTHQRRSGVVRRPVQDLALERPAFTLAELRRPRRKRGDTDLVRVTLTPLVFHVFFAGSGLAIRNKMSPWQGWPGSQFGGSDRSLRSGPWATR